MIVGATGWAMVIPAVKIAGQAVVKEGKQNKVLAMAFGVGLAYVTTPLLSIVLGWSSPVEKVRGVALVSTPDS